MNFYTSIYSLYRERSKKTFYLPKNRESFSNITNSGFKEIKLQLYFNVENLIQLNNLGIVHSASITVSTKALYSYFTGCF